MPKITNLGEFEQVVLLAILRLEDDAYGVSIRNEIELCTERKCSPGALYTTLDRMEKKSFILARLGESTPARGGRAKRFYKLTKEGRSAVVNSQRQFRKLLQGLDILEEKYG
jgi:DNA-binding PadR family transcriptional regulator